MKDNSTTSIVLHSPQRDTELLKELRRALKDKGMNDNQEYNNANEDCAQSIAIYTANDMLVHLHPCRHMRNRIKVSRDDFQTMFLLY